MIIPSKKLDNGFEISEFGLGTWQMGGRDEHDPNNDDQADVRAIRAAIDLGVTQIDTAEIYADGYTEELVGKAIEGYDRKKLFIISKVQAAHMKRDKLLKSCKESLKRVGTGYFDLYLLHRHNPNVPLRETMQAMDELVAEGLIRNIGVANFNSESLREAQDCTKNPIVYDQVHYNLEFREPERDGLVNYCQKNDVFLAAWRPVQKGAFVSSPVAILLEICEKYKKTPAQIAINWLISQKNVITLSKTRTIEHLKENLGAIGWQMEIGDIERLREEYPDQKQVSDAVPLG